MWLTIFYDTFDRDLVHKYVNFCLVEVLDIFLAQHLVEVSLGFVPVLVFVEVELEAFLHFF